MIPVDDVVFLTELVGLSLLRNKVLQLSFQALFNFYKLVFALVLGVFEAITQVLPWSGVVRVAFQFLDGLLFATNRVF